MAKKGTAAPRKLVLLIGTVKVWRTRDRGRTWRALTKGLPQRDHFVGVLRDAMTSDPLSPPASTWARLAANFLFEERRRQLGKTASEFPSDHEFENLARVSRFNAKFYPRSCG